jgi:hypothetical protein
VDQVHVVRHKVLVEGRWQRQVATELGLSRLTVRKYVAAVAPAGESLGASGAAGVGAGERPRRDVAGRVEPVDRRQAAADRDAAPRAHGCGKRERRLVRKGTRP